jgi:hypothetical protein
MGLFWTNRELRLPIFLSIEGKCGADTLVRALFFAHDS